MWTLVLFILIVVAVVVLFALMVAIWLIVKDYDLPYVESPEKRAGKQGERIAQSVISEILREDDILLNNVVVTAEGKQAEFDNIIINSKGVFIIEVKNYSGEIVGDEEDHEWIKNKMSPRGQVYQKTVRNPIGQVKRQIYLLSRHLKNNGIDVWINGYVYFVQHNSPIKNSYILETHRDIDNAIHMNNGNHLDQTTIDRIRRLF